MWTGKVHISDYVVISFYNRPKGARELTRKEGVEQM